MLTNDRYCVASPRDNDADRIQENGRRQGRCSSVLVVGLQQVGGVGSIKLSSQGAAGGTSVTKAGLGQVGHSLRSFTAWVTAVSVRWRNSNARRCYMGGPPSVSPLAHGNAKLNIHTTIFCIVCSGRVSKVQAEQRARRWLVSLRFGTPLTPEFSCSIRHEPTNPQAYTPCIRLSSTPSAPSASTALSACPPVRLSPEDEKKKR